MTSKKKTRSVIFKCLGVLALCVLLFSQAFAQVVSGANGEEQIMIAAGESHVIKAPWPTVRVAVTDPKIADVQILTSDQVLLQGLKVGSTDLIMWSKDENKIMQMSVHVTLDKQQLLDLFPNCVLDINQSGDILVVKGLLRSANQSAQLREYLEKSQVKYVDMTSVAGVQQVQLDVRVVEVSRTAIRALGMNIYNSGSDNFFGHYSLGIQPGASNGGALVTDSVSVFANFGNSWKVLINALAENQYLRVLANPTLVALSGEEASFLAGGEFPIPVVQGGAGTGGTGGENISGNSITIEWKKYGVGLTFRPTVLGDGTIQLYVAPEVSELTSVGSVTIGGFQVPALRTRTFSTILELKNGQTFAMAGLIKRNEDAITSRVPGLGDLPVLGALFRSVRYTNGETEMVVLVTATLVEPMNNAQTPPLPGFTHKEPSDWELYMDGRIEGKEPAKINSADAEWLKQMGLDKLMGPGAWDSYGNSAAPSQAEMAPAAVNSEQQGHLEKQSDSQGMVL